MEAVLHWNELKRDEANGTRIIVSILSSIQFTNLYCYSFISDWQEEPLQQHVEEARFSKRQIYCQKCVARNCEE